VRKTKPTPKRDQSGQAEHHATTPAQFVRQSIGELRKVVWPSGETVRQYWIVVLVFVAFIMAFVSLLDYGLGQLLLKLIG
jgi:preprotein translocase subunit SecE